MKYCLLILASLSAFANEPMNVTLGDAPLNVEVTPISSNQALPFRDVVSDSLVFFLATECGHCQTAVETIRRAFVDKYHCVLVFLDEEAKVTSFLEKTQIQTMTDVYKIDSALLEPYNIKILPSVLVYNRAKLHFAFHGKVTLNKLPFFYAQFDRALEPRGD